MYDQWISINHSLIIDGLLRPSHANVNHCFMIGLIFLGDRWEVLGWRGGAPGIIKEQIEHHF